MVDLRVFAAVLIALSSALFITVDGIQEAREAPLYGLLDEVSHIGYAIAVAESGVPPVLGRDRIFIGGNAPLAPRDVRVPPMESGSTGIPLGPNNDFGQTEAIQPPTPYYLLAPVAAVTHGRDRVVALRIACALCVALAALILCAAVWDLTGIPLAGALAAATMTSFGGLIKVDSWVTNGSFVLLAAALTGWALIDAFRRRRITFPLVVAAGFLSTTQVIAVPLAAAAVLVAAHRAWPERPRREIFSRAALAAGPLALWVLSNLVRYHWPVPKNVAIGGLGPGSALTTQYLEPGYFFGNAFVSLDGGFNGAIQYWKTSPFVYDWRPVGLLIPLSLAAIGFCLFRGSQRERSTLGALLVALVLAHVSFFFMLWLALVTQGSGDFVFRYFQPTFLLGPAIIATSIGMTFGRIRYGSHLIVALCLILLAFNFQASPL